MQAMCCSASYWLSARRWGLEEQHGEETARESHTDRGRDA
jgi:hypothetical protein